MSEQIKIPFQKVFSACPPGLEEITDQWMVQKVVVNQESRSLKAEVLCPELPDETTLMRVQHALAMAYRVEQAELSMVSEKAPETPEIAVAEEENPVPWKNRLRRSRRSWRKCCCLKIHLPALRLSVRQH